MRPIPTDKGTYAIYLQLTKSKTITIGKLGQFNFPRGPYIYVGSAFGPGGLQSRLERHIRGSITFHWHIDYLREEAEVNGFLYLINKRNYECRWVQALDELSDTLVPAPGFGSSDCHRCRSHLMAFRHSDISRYPVLKHKILLETVRNTFSKGTSIPPEEIICSHHPN
jgi:Uri superfamily endonuclease